MNAERARLPPAGTSDLFGLPAEQLSERLDGALGDAVEGCALLNAARAVAEELKYTGEPHPEPPPIAPTPLDGHLAKLPDFSQDPDYVKSKDSSGRQRYALEHDLLLSELELSAPAERGGWTGERQAAPHSANENASLNEDDALMGALMGIADSILALAEDIDRRATTAPAAPPKPQIQAPEAPAGEGDPETTRALTGIAVALAAMAAGEPQETIPGQPEDDDVLVLTDEYLVEPQPAAEQEPEPQPQPRAADDAMLRNTRARIDDLIAAFSPPASLIEDKGDPALPENLAALSSLLGEPPPMNDFDALDQLFECWPRGTAMSRSRALLAVAYNLSRNFGLPGRVPMSASKAWRMLDGTLFEDELVQRLSDIGTFIADWQRNQRNFLILEFGEIELIEYLFEALHPGYHADMLAGVMNFKVLSNRRMGLLRRIPARIKRQVQPLLPERKEEALVIIAHAKALLERLAEPNGFAPIVETSTKMLEEVEKLMKQVAASGAPQMPGGGQALGKIG